MFGTSLIEKVMFEHRPEEGEEVSHEGVWGEKHFRQLKQRGKIPEMDTGSMFTDHQGSHRVYQPE